MFLLCFVALWLLQLTDKVCFATVVDGDTIPMFQLLEVSIVDSHQFLTEKEKQQNKKLLRNVLNNKNGIVNTLIMFYGLFIYG